ncbi:hypothetical protein KAU32_00555 [bacterium]|nr:hypothetical protein [bacterium]
MKKVILKGFLIVVLLLLAVVMLNASGILTKDKKENQNKVGMPTLNEGKTDLKILPYPVEGFNYESRYVYNEFWIYKRGTIGSIWRQWEKIENEIPPEMDPLLKKIFPEKIPDGMMVYIDVNSPLDESSDDQINKFLSSELKFSEQVKRNLHHTTGGYFIDMMGKDIKFMGNFRSFWMNIDSPALQNIYVGEIINKKDKKFNYPEMVKYLKGISLYPEGIDLKKRKATRGGTSKGEKFVDGEILELKVDEVNKFPVLNRTLKIILRNNNKTIRIACNMRDWKPYRKYPLKSPEEAFIDAMNGRGSFVSCSGSELEYAIIEDVKSGKRKIVNRSLHMYQDTIQDDKVFYLAYWEPRMGATGKYLQPVYVLAHIYSNTGEMEPILIVPAIKSEYVEKKDAATLK